MPEFEFLGLPFSAYAENGKWNCGTFLFEAVFSREMPHWEQPSHFSRYSKRSGMVEKITVI